MNTLKLNLMIASVLLLFVSSAQAIPTLQIYMEGATYNTANETWTLNSPGTFKLWVLGQGGVYDVKLAAAFNTGETGTISLTPTMASNSYLPFSGADPTTPITPQFNGWKADGTIPVMGSGDTLPSHGIYGPGTSWAEWLLGNFLGTNDKVADMTANPLNWKPGQLNAYDVTITGFTYLHFDAYDHTVASNGKYKYVFAPFSHDAENIPIPEPATIILLGVGLLGMGLYRNRSINRK